MATSMEDNDVASNTSAVPASELLTHSLSVQANVFDNQTIITKVVSLLSAMGSAYIFTSMVVGGRKKKIERTFDRLLMCLCVSDFISSLSLFLGSW